jgi:hypothetical protein
MFQRLATGLLMLAVVACAQRRVDPKNTYHRVICVVPLIGTGTAADPRRPQYAPLVTAAHTALPTDIIAFTQVPTDDGTFAIVEFVAQDRKAFLTIFADANVTTFEKGVASKAAIETALQKVKKGFSLDQFEVTMP